MNTDRPRLRPECPCDPINKIGIESGCHTKLLREHRPLEYAASVRAWSNSMETFAGLQERDWDTHLLHIESLEFVVL